MGGRHGTIAERFWAKVKKTPRCWVWTASTVDGYGRMGTVLLAPYKMRLELAHRISWQIHKGDIPEGLLVLHRCDNSLCVRPSHLFLGTDADNAADCVRKGRKARLFGDDNPSRKHPERLARGDRNYTRRHPEIVTGERNPRAKLTDAKVKAIRSLYKSGLLGVVQLAKVFGVSDTTVRHVLDGDTWKHVP